MTMYKTKVTDKNDMNEKICVVTKHTVTLTPNHSSISPLTPINYTGSIQTNTLLEMEENPFFLIE